MTEKNGKTEDVGSRYASYWSEPGDAHNGLNADASPEDREARLVNYKACTVDYYEIVSDLYEAGWNRRFHYCPFPGPHDSIDAALDRHEHFLALMMQLKPGMRGIEFGSGIGGPSMELARFAKAHITGVNISGLGVRRATDLAASAGMSNMLTYVEADFMHVPYPDAHFDFAYAIEATLHAPSLAAVYAEMARVVKPGARVGIYEWLLTSRFDESVHAHREIRARIERGNGILALRGVDEALAALAQTGLEVEHTGDVHASTASGSSTSGGDDVRVGARPWYWPLDGSFRAASCWADWWVAFKLQPWFYRTCVFLTWVWTLAGIAPASDNEAMRTIGECVWGVRDGGRAGIFTPGYMMVARKPVRGWKVGGKIA